MIKCDKAKRLVTFQKVEATPLDINILAPMREAYKNYCTPGNTYTIYDDVKYFFETVLSKFNDKYTATVSVGDMNERGRYTMTKDKYLYYPVNVCVYKRNTDGSTTTLGSLNGNTILELPYMTDMSRLSTRNGEKVCLGILKSAEDVSYDFESGIYSIALPGANVRIKFKQTKTKYSITILDSKNGLALDKLIQGMLYQAGDHKTRVHDIFVDNYSRTTLTVKPKETAENISEYNSVLKFTDKFSAENNQNNDMYNLGANTRESLNDLYNLSNAEGYVTSRNICDINGNVVIPANTEITKSLINKLHRNCINIVYVKNYDVDFRGYILANHISFRDLPKGTVNCAFLKTILPQYSKHDIIPETIYGTEDEPVIDIPLGTKITAELIDFFLQIPITTIQCYKPGTDDTITFSLEREIIGNHMVRLGELVDTIPEGRHYNDWVYTFNNSTFAPTPQSVLEHFTVHDFMAILADVCRINEVGQSTTLQNRDDAFLKRLTLVDEQFSKYFRRVISDRYNSEKKIKKYIESLVSGANVSYTLTEKWLSAMYLDNVLVAVEGTNIIDEMSQLTHANIALKEPPDKMRHLAMPYYGRICPLETPAGKQLGMVNSRTIGCIVDPDGTMRVPYYKIISAGGRPKINKDVIHKLSPKQERGNKFVDLLDLKVDKDGYIEDGLVLARIPNPEKGEPFIISKIPTSDLIHSDKNNSNNTDVKSNWCAYVNINPEQMLSLTTSLIPFAGSDDAVRVTYGDAQIKQTIPLVDSQVPHVITSMYNKMLTYQWYDVVTSPCDGVVQERKEIVTGRMYIKNDATGKIEIAKCCDMDSWEYKGSDYNYVFEMVYPGEHVVKGQPIMCHYDVPTNFLTPCRRNAFIDDPGPEYVNTTEHINHVVSNISVFENNGESYRISNSRISENSIAMTDLHFYKGNEVHTGDLLATTSMTQKGYYSPSRNALIAYIIAGYNHEDGILVSEAASQAYTSMIVHKITVPVPDDKDYTCRLAPNLHYVNAGEVLANLYLANRIDLAKPEKVVYADKNEDGIPFEWCHEYDSNSGHKYIVIYTLAFNKLSDGDKMAGRHGNKGVNSKVLPNSQMPQFMNGKIPDIILNPLGVPSRMNLGQIHELYPSFVGHVLNITFQSDSINGASPEEVAMLQHFIYDYSQWLKRREVTSAETLMSKTNSIAEYQAFNIPADFFELAWEGRDGLYEWIDVFDRDGMAKMYDPETDTYYRAKVTFGYAYFNKLEQEVAKKVCARSGPIDEEYSATSFQPLKNEVSKQGQRLGEMELIALAAYGASALLEESLNEKSDNPGASYNKHAQALGYINNVPLKYCQSAAVENLYNYLTALGLKITFDSNVGITLGEEYDMQGNKSKYTYDLKRVINNNNKSYIHKNKTVEVMDPEKIFNLGDTYDQT